MRRVPWLSGCQGSRQKISGAECKEYLGVKALAHRDVFVRARYSAPLEEMVGLCPGLFSQELGALSS